MTISYSWLKKFIHLPYSVEETAAMLTRLGLEVEGIEERELIRGGLKGVVVGNVLTCEPHPNADKLRITTVDIGAGEALQIVCGAPNVAKGQKVPVALVGTTLYPTEGEPITLKKSKIRGELSEGMICAADELGLGADHSGIMVFPDSAQIGTPAAKQLNLNSDFILEIGLTANRIDAASHYGVARDLHALTGNPLQKPKALKLQIPSIETIKVFITAPEKCGRYAALKIDGLKVASSPDWLKTAIETIGLGSINNVVDITNYVLHSIGQPLHAFDAKYFPTNEVVVRTALNGEKFTALDGSENTLSADDLVISNGKEVHCLAGIMGGKTSGVSTETTSIILESAWFEPTTVRKSAKRHNLRSDSSFRFERGADRQQVLEALCYAAELITEIAGGQVVGGYTDVHLNPTGNKVFTVSYDYLDTLIGVPLERELVHGILRRLEIEVKPIAAYGHIGFEQEMEVTVPFYRVDVTRPADIAEEILRVYGLDTIPLNAHSGTAFFEPQPKIQAPKLQRIIGELLAGNGFNEILTNSLTTAERNEKLAGSEQESIKIINPLSEELTQMRRSLLIGMLDSVQHNLNRKNKDLKLVEWGKIYSQKEGKTFESYRMCLALTGADNAESWQKPQKEVGFPQMVNTVSQILNRLNLNGFNLQEQPIIWAEYGAIIKDKKRDLGFIGKVHPNLLKKWGIKQAVFIADLDWDKLVKAYGFNQVYQPISKFPEVRRDLSLVIDKSITYNELQKIAAETERKLLKETDAFDVFEGGNLKPNQKAVALNFILQDTEATLTDSVIEKTMEKLIKAYETKVNALVRK